MLEAVKRYARKVLLFHLFLLMVVVVVVLCAARSVYRSTRLQFIQESAKRQEMLSEQMALGIENYYLSVMSDLDLILRDDSDAAATQPMTIGQERPGGRGAGMFAARLNRRTQPITPALANNMWSQLHGRVSGLFVVENETGAVWGSKGNTELNLRIAHDQLEWFRSVNEPSMSHLQAGDKPNEGYHLIAIPAEGNSTPLRRPRPSETMPAQGLRPQDRPATPQTVVAIVPVQIVRDKFFNELNRKGMVNAALLDDAGTVLVSENPKLVGMNVVSEMTPGLVERLGPLIKGERSGTYVADQTYKIGNETFEPRIMAFEHIKGLPGRQWTVLTTSPLSDAELPVNDLFKEAMTWTVFLAISVTGILASTSFFMIRSRVRYERSRHDMLARELDQARQIQLAWLPDSQKVPAGLEVSAANLPASHISGDFYNWFDLPAPSYSRHTAEPADLSGAEAPSKVAIVIGDVTGHGMAAAFLMATTQLLVRTTLARYQDPGRCMQEVNRQLCTQGFRGQFVTMLVIVLDPRSSSIEIATAGHPAPLVERNGKFVSLEMEPQLVLGVDPNETYKTEGFILEPGASVMLYTDGVVEAEADKGEQYGLERLCAALSAVKGGQESDPQARIHAVLEDVKRFCAEKDLADDVTLVAVRTTAAVQLSAEIGA